MIAEVRGFAALRGARGRPRGDLEALAEATAALSRLAAAPEGARVLDAEINPMLVREEGAGVVAVDGLVRLAGGEAPHG